MANEQKWSNESTNVDLYMVKLFVNIVLWNILN